MSNRRKRGKKLGEFIKHAGDLRLLEHNLGNENFIRADRVFVGKTPREIISLILFIPFEKLRLQRRDAAICVESMVLSTDAGKMFFCDVDFGHMF